MLTFLMLFCLAGAVWYGICHSGGGGSGSAIGSVGCLAGAIVLALVIVGKF